MKGASVAVLGLLASVPVSAQELISPEMFLDLADGKTLTFHDYHSGDLVGVEEYLNRSLSVWRDRTGTCVYGRITTEDGKLCFLYDNDADGLPVCWWPFLDGDRILVRTARFWEVEVQEVVKVSEDGLSCPSAPSV